jgi:hypothetical protein
MANQNGTKNPPKKLKAKIRDSKEIRDKSKNPPLNHLKLCSLKRSLILRDEPNKPKITATKI